MSKTRTIRTREQRIADAKAEVVRLEQQDLKEAIGLRTQALGWLARSEELTAKALGAIDKANSLITALGHNSDEFWTEYDKGQSA